MYGYRKKIAWWSLTHLLSYPQSRYTIESKNDQIWSNRILVQSRYAIASKNYDQIE